jgi:hypothetical protein
MIQILLATSLLLQSPDTSRIRTATSTMHRITPPISATSISPTSIRATSIPADTSRGLPFGDDKLQHFFVTFAVYDFSYAGDRALGMNRKAALIDAAGAAVVIAIGKEIYDMRHHKKFSGYDLIADALGGVAAYGLLKQIHE